MYLKRYKDFKSINEEKEDNGEDHYYDNNIEKLEDDLKRFKQNKFKLDTLIKKFDHSDSAKRKLEKILMNNSLLIKYWANLSRMKRIDDLKNKIKLIEEEIKILKKEDPKQEKIKEKQESIKKILDDMKELEKEHKESEKTHKESEKEIKKKILDLKKKLV